MLKYFYNLFYLKLLIIIFVIIIAGCKTKKWCPVETVFIPSIHINEKCNNVKTVYFSKDYIIDSGNFLSDNDKELILGFLKEVFNELHYVNFIPERIPPSTGDFFHIMSINISCFKIEMEKNDLGIKKNFYLGFDMSIVEFQVYDNFTCMTTNYGINKFSIGDSIESGFNTLSDELLKSKHIKEALQEKFYDLFPRIEVYIRHVKPENSVITELLHQLPPDCDTAIQILQNNKDKFEKYIYYYNLGVAYECKAKYTNDQDKKLELLLKAQESYYMAFSENPKDNEIQEAKKNVDDVIKIYQQAIENQKK